MNSSGMVCIVPKRSPHIRQFCFLKCCFGRKRPLCPWLKIPQHETIIILSEIEIFTVGYKWNQFAETSVVAVCLSCEGTSQFSGKIADYLCWKIGKATNLKHIVYLLYLHFPRLLLAKKNDIPQELDRINDILYTYIKFDWVWPGFRISNIYRVCYVTSSTIKLNERNKWL